MYALQQFKRVSLFYESNWIFCLLMWNYTWRWISFCLVYPLYNRPRVTLLNAATHTALLTIRTLLYGNDNLELEENWNIITDTLKFIKDSERFDWCCIRLNSQFCYARFWLCKFCISSFIVNISYVIVILVSIYISALLVWILINLFNIYTSFIPQSHCTHSHPATCLQPGISMTKMFVILVSL